MSIQHDDVIKWKHFPRYWPFVWGIHRSPMNSPHKGQWGGALMFHLICAWTNGWINNCDAGDLRRHRSHYDVTLMDTESIIRTQVSVLSDGLVWTLKPLGTQWCVLSSVATDALVLKHQTISNHSAEWIFIELDWFHVDVLHLLWTVLKNRTHNLKKNPNQLF